MGLRQTINEKPLLGWIVAAVLGVVAIVFGIRVLGGSNSGEPSLSQLKQEITIRDIETGETWTMDRGRIEKELYLRAHDGTLDPEIGLTNPNTGRPTGFPDLRGGWADMVERIQREVSDANSRRHSS